MKAGVATRLGVALCAAIIAGCATVYQYDGQSYASKDDALRAVARDVDASVSAVRPLDVRVEGYAEVVLPNYQRIQQMGVVAIGAGKPSADRVDYIVQLLRLDYLGMAEAVRRTAAFESVVVSEAYDPKAFASTAPWTIYLDLKSQDAAQWYLREKATGRVVPVGIDTGVDRALRTAEWAARIARTATQSSAATADVSAKSSPPDQPSAMGSGFLVASGGLIVSNDHVVSECSRISTSRNGLAIPLAIIAHDEANDLALLKGDVAASVARFSMTPPTRGAPVLAVGFPLRGLLAEQVSVSEGVIANLSGLGGDSRTLQITAPVQPGNSGGPLLDTYGHVIGMVSSTVSAARIAKGTGTLPQNINFAIKSSVITSFLEAHGVAYRTVSGPPARPVGMEEASVIGEAMAVAIDCWP